MRYLPLPKYFDRRALMSDVFPTFGTPMIKTPNSRLLTRLWRLDFEMAVNILGMS